MWIFGYGSLLWYTNFPYDRCVYGRVRGFARRFWQKSPDHRGTEQFPGRTVTLVADDDAEVWGAAYKVNDRDVSTVRQYLDHRERAGYELKTVTFHPDTNRGKQEEDGTTSTGMPPFQLHVYISLADPALNRHFAGPEPIEHIANIIVQARGPSGSNIEYLLKLAYQVRTKKDQLEHHDEHLFTLERRVLDLCQQMGVEDHCFHELGIQPHS